MKKLLIFIGIILAVVILTLAGGTLYLLYGDLSRFKPQLENAISDVTGREFRIAGTFDPEVLPVLSLVVEDFSLANADWSETAIQAQVGHLTAKVDPWALWSNTIRIEELQLRDVELLIETGPEQQSNLDFPRVAGTTTTDDPTAPPGTPFTIDLASAGVSKLRVVLRSHAAADTVIALDSLQASTDSAGNLKIAAAAAIDNHRIETKGLVGPLAALLEADAFTVDLAGSVAPETMPQLPYSVASRIAVADTMVHLDELAATIGSSDISGKVTIDNSAAMSLSGELRSRLIDLTEFATGDETPEPVATPPADPPADRILSDAPLDYSPLRKGRIDLTASIGELRTGEQDFTALELDVSLAEGKLSLDNRFAVSGGGSGKGTVQLNSATDPAELTVDMNISSLPIIQLAGSDAPAENVPAADLQVAITASGASPRALAASSNGKVHFDLGAGRLENRLLETVSGDLVARLFDALNPFAKKEPYSKLQCAYFDLQLTDGVGKLQNLVVQSKKLQILGEGTVDLNTEKLSITFNTKPRAGIGISADMFVTPFVRLAGTLAKPTVGLNKSGAALTTGGAIATGGLSILAQNVADRLTAEVDRCKDRNAPPPQQQQ